MQSSLRKIQEECKIRHVKNLLPRIASKIDVTASDEQINYSGNPYFITHQSRIKNMNMYFRVKKTKINDTPSALYTVENSSKSWIIVKEMLKNILIELRSLGSKNIEWFKFTKK